MRVRSAAVRDILTLVVVFGVLLGGLFLYTGTWPPAVIVESSSMMHLDSEVTYGRSWASFGPATIDPGDLVLVKAADDVSDIETLVEGGKKRYGMSGDVIVFYPRNDRGETPIIHRAVAYVEVVGSGDSATYRMRWNPDAPCEGGARKDGSWCIYGSDGVLVPSVPIGRPGSSAANPLPYRAEHTGFLTKGDNPFTNRNIDQVSQLSPPVRIDWVEGKGRGELPWLGLIKLSLADKINEKNPPSSWVKIGNAYAPKDLWVMLGVTLFVLVGVPLLYDGYKSIQNRRRPPPDFVPSEDETGSAPSTPPIAMDPPPSEIPPAEPTDRRDTSSP